MHRGGICQASIRRVAVMRYYPVSLDVQNKDCLVVGGGSVGERKVKTLLECRARVTVVTTVATGCLQDFAIEGRIDLKIRDYEPSDLEGFSMVYACTNDEETNKRIKKDSESRRILVNVCDNAGECDFISPAVYQKENITVAVSSHARDVKKAVKIRNTIQEMLENDQI